MAGYTVVFSLWVPIVLVVEQMVQDAEMRREQHRNILLDLLEKTEAVSSLLYEKHLSREKMGEVVMQLSNRIRLELNQALRKLKEPYGRTTAL